MSLKFPNARLFMHNLLANGELSGAQAIALSACEFGLLDYKEVQKLITPFKRPSTYCSCMETAKGVMVTYFKQRNDSTSEIDTDNAWSALQTAAANYEMGSRTHLGSDSHSCLHECSKFAPALFDLMLQQIRRYP